MTLSVVAAFLAVDVLLVLTPGADWAYAIAAGLGGRTVLPAVTGLVTGYAGYTVLVVAGLAVLVARTPGLLTVLTALGAVYLLWLGYSVLARPGVPGDAGERGTGAVAARSPWRVFARRGRGQWPEPQGPSALPRTAPAVRPPRPRLARRSPDRPAGRSAYE